MKTEFDNLSNNTNHSYETNCNGDKQVVKIYCGEKLIAKKLNHKKSTRYLGIKEYQEYLLPD